MNYDIVNKLRRHKLVYDVVNGTRRPKLNYDVVNSFEMS